MSNDSWSYGHLGPTLSDIHDGKIRIWKESHFGEFDDRIIFAVIVGAILLANWFPLIAVIFFLIVVVGFVIGQMAWVVFRNRMMRRAMVRMSKSVDPLMVACRGDADIKQIIDNGLEGKFYQFVYAILGTRIYRTALDEDLPIIPRVGGWHCDTIYFRFADDHNRVLFKLGGCA